MDPVRYFELRQMIVCGELDCLKNCCTIEQLRLVRSVLTGVDDNDLEIIERLLCGCAAPQHGQLPPPASTQTCVTALREWTCANRTLVQGAKAGLLSIVDIDPTWNPVIGAMILMMDDLLAACGTEDQSQLERLVARYCDFIRWYRELVTRLAGGPGWIREGVLGISAIISPMSTIINLCCPETNVGVGVTYGPTTPTSTSYYTASTNGNSAVTTQTQASPSGPSLGSSTVGGIPTPLGTRGGS
jgi:hypothetical protein